MQLSLGAANTVLFYLTECTAAEVLPPSFAAGEKPSSHAEFIVPIVPAFSMVILSGDVLHFGPDTKDFPHERLVLFFQFVDQGIPTDKVNTNKRVFYRYQGDKGVVGPKR
jgi:hypothetical protein